MWAILSKNNAAKRRFFSVFGIREVNWNRIYRIFMAPVPWFQFTDCIRVPIFNLLTDIRVPDFNLPIGLKYLRILEINDLIGSLYDGGGGGVVGDS